MLVKKRLQIYAVGAVITAFVLVLMLLLALNRVNRAVEEADIAGDIMTCAFERSTLRSDYLRTDSERAKKQWFAKHEQMDGLLQSALEKFREAEDKKNIREMIKDQAATEKIFSGIVENREKAKSDAGSASLSQETESRLVSQLEMRLYDKVLNARKLHEAADSHLFSALRLAGGAIIWVLAAVTTAIVVSSWTMGRTIANRIARLRDGASFVGGGNLDHRINIEGNDELAELSVAFDTMTAKLQGSYLDLEKEIAERMQMEEALRESEERYRVIAETALDSIITIDEESRILFANPATERLFGYTCSELEGKPVTMLMPERLRDAHLDAMNRHAIDGQWHLPIGAIGLPGLHISGMEVPLEISYGQFIKNGKHFFIGTIRDITERKRAEEVIIKNEARLKRAQEIAHLGSWELDIHSNTLTWSDEVYRIFGLKPQEFSATYEAFLEAVHPDDRKAVDAAYSGSLREGKDSYEIEHRVVRKSTGEIRYVHERCEHVRDEKGKIIQSVGMVHDITERTEVQEAQKESDRRYRSLFENMLDGFAYCKMLCDDQGRPEDFIYLDVNSAFSRLTGLDNVVGKKITELIPGIKESNPEVFEIYGRVALTGRPETFEFELKILGIWLFVAVYSTQRGYFVAVFDNITERKQAEEALQKANNELETRVAERTEELEESRSELEMQNDELRETYLELEAETAERIAAIEQLREKDRMLIQQSRMAAMGEMLGNIAHQWRQPLNMIGLMIQDLEISYECGQFNKEVLERNVAKAMEILLHLSQTIDDFTNFAIPDKEKSVFRVNEVIDRTVSLIQDNFQRQRITIEVDSRGDTQINGYPNEYAQVLLNILMNAHDAFLQHGTTNALITVRSWEESDRAVVTVTDNAGGIEEEIMDKIFDPYFTTKDLGKGTGLGLFMSKTIIEKSMGGRIAVRNVNGGAEFRIEV